eukprot:4355276-Alexandrium_andersonii.AAC.1
MCFTAKTSLFYIGPLIRHLHEEWRGMHPSRAWGTMFEVVSGAAQFRCRTPPGGFVGSGFGPAGGLRSRFYRF